MIKKTVKYECDHCGCYWFDDDKVHSCREYLDKLRESLSKRGFEPTNDFISAKIRWEDVSWRLNFPHPSLGVNKSVALSISQNYIIELEKALGTLKSTV